MKTGTKRFLTVFVVFFAGTLQAFSQYTGPAGQSYTVDYVLSHAEDLDRQDEWVHLTGRIVRQVDDDKYVFEDRTGTMTVEFDDDLTIEEPFDETTTVKITGEVEYEGNKPVEFEVEQLVFVDP